MRPARPDRCSRKGAGGRVEACLGRGFHEACPRGQGGDDPDLLGGGTAWVFKDELIIGDSISEARVGPLERELELGLDHRDGLGDLGVLLDEDNVGALDLDGAALFAADDGVGHKRVEFF